MRALPGCTLCVEKEAGLVEAIEQEGVDVGLLGEALVATGAPAVAGIAVGADEDEMLISPLGAHHGNEFGGHPGIDAMVVEADGEELGCASLSIGEQESGVLGCERAETFVCVRIAIFSKLIGTVIRNSKTCRIDDSDAGHDGGEEIRAFETDGRDEQAASASAPEAEELRRRVAELDEALAALRGN